ncbi:MAG TPA: hypothetical protein VGM03_09575 [Phycisphaerae bacterium]|jgi:hypothetical protein
MQRFAVLLLGIAGVWCLGSLAGCTLTQTPHEHSRQIKAVAAQDARALVEDLDIFCLTDRPTRLSRWHSR